MGAMEVGERRNQPKPTERRQGTDANDVAFVGEAAEGRFEHFERRPHLLVQVSAFRTQRHHTRGAIEKCGAKQLLQLADAVADCTIRDIQVVRGLVKALPACHGVECHD